MNFGGALVTVVEVPSVVVNLKLVVPVVDPSVENSGIDVVGGFGRKFGLLAG